MLAQSKPKKIGLFGTGNWSKNYSSELSLDSRWEVIELTQYFGGAKSIYANGVDAKHFVELIHSLDLHGVIIATAPSLQQKLAIECILNDVPLILEKPITTDLVGINKIKNALTQVNSSKILVNHFHFFDEKFIKFSSCLQEHRLKKILIRDGSLGPRRGHLDPLFDWGPHSLGICLGIFKHPPSIRKVRCIEKIDKRIGKVKVYFVVLALKETIIFLRFGNGFTQKKREVRAISTEVREPFVFSIIARSRELETKATTTTPMQNLLLEFHSRIEGKYRRSHHTVDIALGTVKLLNEIKNKIQ